MEPPSAAETETSRPNRPRVDRTYLACAIAAVLLVAIGLLPKRQAKIVETGIPQRELYAMKLAWGPEFDVVLGGNSRVTVGLDPAQLAAELGGLRVGNFGFDGNGFGPDYLAAMEARLDPRSRRRMLVLGVSPMTLTERAARQNGFNEERRRPLDERILIAHWPRFMDFFERFNPRMAVVWLRAQHQVSTEYFRGTPSGFAAQDMEPRNLGLQVDFLRANAPDRAFPVSPALRSGLIAQVQRWREAGIEVAAFRPPTSDALHREELRVTGYAEEDFVREFTAAGGMWIDVPADGFETYDGGHLVEKDAARLSRSLGVGLAAFAAGKREKLR